MCGRIASWRSPDDLSALFEAMNVVAEPLPSRYNVAPTAEVYAVAGTRSGRRLGTMSWGLVPAWSEGPESGLRPINARAETLLDKRLYAESFLRRRCLVPADGFYEWRTGPDGSKQPHFLASPDGSPLALAGLWDRWTGRDGRALVSVAIVTTPANALVARLHDRMPAILPPASWETWLDPATDDPAPLQALLQPAPAESLGMQPVITRVNSTVNDGPELLDPPDQTALALPF